MDENNTETINETINETTCETINETKYRDVNFNVVVKQLFDDVEAMDIFEYILANAKFKTPRMNKDGSLSKRRNKVIYGEIPEYKAVFQGRELSTPVVPWSELPELEELRNYITEITGQYYNVCVIQHYNSGEVSINPHRDKEMKRGTIIASLSLGETRIMKFDFRNTSHEIPLPSGSLCLINPPTNDYWAHSIPKDDTQGSRISVIFRLYI